ncbi:winged helix DNA-binding domain-containing protein [Nocardia asteroides]|uniref:winged helix DNA-binding domain-containing protein n=1 Tax=Nocardia asteroides TaxID=1824 RepID=UPI001E550BF3|nr:winged helix DNA-binding domain-containing protein [Nocardia asteroides]UGT64581.1 winged helix DNA-binding domain-containing protein [Nocardia asteroides]
MTAAGDRLSDRTLNRTLLARQHLLAREPLGIAALCEHLIGLQAQDVPPPFVGAWSRIAGFDRSTVDSGLEDRSLVRITLMRGTIHLVTAADALRIAPHIQPELEKVPFRRGFNFGAMVGLDPEEVRARGESAVGADPISAAELRAAALAHYPDRQPGHVVQAWLYQLPVLQVPPRGRWRDNSKPVWARIEPWLGAPLDRGYPLAELLARYLAAFGPASTADMQTWSKLPGAKQAIDSLGDRVRTYTDERGKVLYDLADAELTAPDVPAPVRLLGWYDNATLAHRYRARILPLSAQRAFPVMVSPVLVDGFVAGHYRITGGTARIVPARPWSAAERAEVEAEAHALLGFLEPEREPEVLVLDQDADIRG